MLVKLLPEQIASHWDEIGTSVERSMPNGLNGKTQKVLSRLLSGDMQCWILFDSGGGVKAQVITCIVEDVSGRGRELLIYSIWGYEKVPRELWEKGLETIRKFAGSRGCERITAYTNVPQVIQLANSFGADTSWRLIVLEV